MSEFEEYIVHGEPGQKEKADAWQTAIGLQDVDGLKVSAYLLDTARQHIEGDITIDEARERIKAYYQTKSGHDEVDEEGDKASVNIAKILSEPSFAFSLVGLTSIHRRIFEGIFKFAGQLRNVELSKRNGCLAEMPLLATNRLLTSAKPSNMTSLAKRNLITLPVLFPKLSITWRGLLPTCGRFILFVRGIHVPPLYS